MFIGSEQGLIGLYNVCDALIGSLWTLCFHVHLGFTHFFKIRINYHQNRPWISGVFSRLYTATGGKALLKGDKSIKAGVSAADPGAPPAGLQVQLCCSPTDIQCMASV